MVRKLTAERVTEIAVMEVAQVSVRTRTRTRARAQTEAMAATSATSTSKLAKRRKLNREEVRFSSSYIQLRNRTINTGTTTASESRCSSPRLEILDHDRVSTSCCSSNGSSERMEFVDLKDKSVEAEVETSTHYSCRERREMTQSNELEAEAEAEAEAAGLNSKAQTSSEANSYHRSPVEKMPTDSEIEDFFAEVEKNLLKKFSEKYNFDFKKEKPQEGRYEWVRLKP